MVSQPATITPRQLRSIVTEEPLQVSPDILGRRLAPPWRRAAAMSVDGLVVAILANAPGVLFGLAAALVLFRASRPSVPGAGYIRRSFRFTSRLGGALVLFGVAVSLWGSVSDRLNRDDDDGRNAGRGFVTDRGGASTQLNLSGVEAVQFAGEVVALHRAESEEAARAEAERLLQRMLVAGMAGPDARNALRDLAGDVEGRPWVAAAVQAVVADHAIAETEPASPADPELATAPSADSVVLAYSAALAAEDSAAADSLLPRVVAEVSADTVRVLAGRIQELDSDQRALRTRVGQLEDELEEGPGILATMRSIAEDLGLGLGWFGLYFTATTALWRGKTPGKRLFGIRVVRLTGRPIGWWASFERFGGYAAGVATGLLGFLQILWDDNRQATHDKIAGTAVILD